MAGSTAESIMKKTFVSAVLLAMVFMPSLLGAKGRTIRITIEGASLSSPIEITDPQVVDNFNVWTGPGTSLNEIAGQTTYPDGFIIRWPQGLTAKPSKGLPQYQISFYTTDRKGPSYVVYYRYDLLTKSGYVYLPGPAEKWYRLNTSSILHGIEGNWFRARALWDSTAEPLILRASTKQALQLLDSTKGSSSDR